MITALFVIAFVLRFLACITPAIWYDEAYSLRVASMPIERIVAIRDLTPPLWEIILHPFVSLWYDVLVIRIIALALSMLSMWLAFRIARELQFTKAGTAITLFLVAVLPGMTWMSSDGRGYALLSCLYLSGALCVVKRNGIGLLISSALALYTHVTAAFLIASLFAFALMRGIKVKPLVNIGLALLVLWLPWIRVMVGIVTNPTAGSPYEALTFEYFLEQLAAAFWIGSPALLYYAGFALTIVTIAAHPKQSALIFLPVIGMALVSLASGFTLITYRTISPVLMPFALMLGQSSRRWLYAWLPFLVCGAVFYQFDVKGGDQARAARMIDAAPARVVYATLTTALPFDYYIAGDDSCLLQLSTAPAPAPDFGFEPCAPSEIAAPYWFIVPDEPLIPRAEFARMQSIAAAGTLKRELYFLQTSPVKIYFVDAQ